MLAAGRSAAVVVLAVLLGLSAFAPFTPVVAAVVMVAVVVTVETAPPGTSSPYDGFGHDRGRHLLEPVNLRRVVRRRAS